MHLLRTVMIAGAAVAASFAVASSANALCVPVHPWDCVPVWPCETYPVCPAKPRAIDQDGVRASAPAITASNVADALKAHR